MSDEQWPKASGDPVVLGEYWEQVFRSRKDFPDDEIPALPLDMGPGYMGGVMGSPVRYEHGTTWADHSLADYSGLPSLRNVRFRPVQSLDSEAAERSGNLRGKEPRQVRRRHRDAHRPRRHHDRAPGAGRALLDFFENPEKLKRLGEICTNALLETAKLQFERVPSFENGFVDNYNIWTPGKSSYFANDISNLVSRVSTATISSPGTPRSRIPRNALAVTSTRAERGWFRSSRSCRGFGEFKSSTTGRQDRPRRNSSRSSRRFRKNTCSSSGSIPGKNSRNSAGTQTGGALRGFAGRQRGRGFSSPRLWDKKGNRLPHGR